VLAIDNAGTVELAVVNISGGSVLDETTLVSTTAIAAASNSATAYYSTTARTSVAYRVVGYVESTQAIAGTWLTAPSTIQGYGGQALNSMSSLGYGQTWQNVFASRASGTTYYNTTGKPIYIIINSNQTAGATLTINGTVVYTQVANSVRDTNSFVIPVGVSYVYTASTAIYTWSELR